MNHTCNGSFFRYQGKEYYRCLYDGKIIETLPDSIIKYGNCPNCNRPMVSKKIKVSFKVVIQAKFWKRGTWEDFQEIGELK